MGRSSRILIILLCSLLMSSVCFAQRSAGSRIYFSLAAKGMMGSMGSVDDKAVKSRKAYVYGGEAVLGMTFGSFLVGISGEYNLWKQKTKPSEVGDTNTAGTQMNVAPVLGAAFGNFLLSFKPYLYSKFSLDKKDSAGEEGTYTTPRFPSYGVQLSYRLGLKTFVGVEYTSTEYKKAEAGSNKITLTEDQRMNYSALGVIYGYKF